MIPRLAAALGLAVLVAAVYAPVRTHDFVSFDDHHYVVENPMLVEPLSPDSVASAFRPYLLNWIPLTLLSLQLDRAIWGEGPLGHLVGNAILHWAAASLLFVALLHATRPRGATPPLGSASRWDRCGRCFFVAAVFAVHPLHVESVAWISARKDVLSGVFFAATLLAWSRHADRPGAGRYLAAALTFALGLMAKPTLVTLPFLLLLLDAWPLERLHGLRELVWRVIEKLPLFALALAASIVTWWVQAESGATWVVPPPLAERVANAIDASTWYVAKTLWPRGLAVFYPYPASFSLARSLGEAALLLGVTALAVATARRHPYGLVGWLWFLGMLVPVSGLVQVGMQARADRYTYLPQIGLTVSVAWAAVAVAPRAESARRTAVALGGLGAACILVLAAAARQQVHVWSDTRSLFEHARSVTAPNFQAERALARLAWLSEDLAQAERHYRASLAAEPDWAETHLDLANLLRARGRIPEALRHYRLATKLDLANPAAPAALGSLLVQHRRFEEGERAIEIALERHPDDAQLHADLAAAAFARGALASAMDSARTALALDPTQADAAATLAWLLARHPDPAQRNAAQAIAIAERALEIASDDEHRLLAALAAGHAAAGRLQQAEDTATRALARAEELGDEPVVGLLRAELGAYRAQRRRSGLETPPGNAPGLAPLRPEHAAEP